MASPRERKGGVRPESWAKHLRPIGKRRHNKAVRQDESARVELELGVQKPAKRRGRATRKPYVVQLWHDGKFLIWEAAWWTLSRHRTMRQAEQSLRARSKAAGREEKYRVRVDQTKSHRVAEPGR